MYYFDDQDSTYYSYDAFKEEVSWHIISCVHKYKLLVISCQLSLRSSTNNVGEDYITDIFILSESFATSAYPLSFVRILVSHLCLQVCQLISGESNHTTRIWNLKTIF